MINKIASPRHRTHASRNRNKFVFLAKKQGWYKAGTGLVQSWYRAGTGLVQGWYRAGAGLVQGWHRAGAGLPKPQATHFSPCEGRAIDVLKQHSMPSA